MEQHVRSFFGQKSALFLDSGSWFQENIYLTVIKKKSNGIWEKPSENEGRKIKLNLGEILMLRRVFMGLETRWSTVHRFKDNQTRISVNADPKNSEQVWFNIEEYHKSIQPPETELFLLLLAHIIDEKIKYATGRKEEYKSARKLESHEKIRQSKAAMQKQRQEKCIEKKGSIKSKAPPVDHGPYTQTDNNNGQKKAESNGSKNEKGKYFCKTYSL